MGQSPKRKSIIPQLAAFFGAVALIASSGCSLLSSREEDAGKTSAGKVASNANDIALPVEINNAIGKIASGGGTQVSAPGYGGGRVNVNVNVNFNGRSWTNTVTETTETGEVLNTSEKVERQPAAADQMESGDNYSDSLQSSVSESRGSGEGKSKKYVVKPGDTLMKISFESYGNVYRWREILNANKSKIANYSALAPGTELIINGVNYVVINRNGKPYLIVRRDTLGKISQKVYGTNSFWRDLWKNNPQLIRDPNKIYAGFTLYYREKSELGTPVHTAKNSRDRLPTRSLPSKRSPANKKK